MRLVFMKCYVLSDLGRNRVALFFSPNRGHVLSPRTRSRIAASDINLIWLILAPNVVSLKVSFYIDQQPLFTFDG